jgi:hypothetical protein
MALPAAASPWAEELTSDKNKKDRNRDDTRRAIGLQRIIDTIDAEKCG